MRVQLKCIMCATDFSDLSRHAIDYAVALAKEFRAKLYMCHVIDLSPAAIYGEAVLALEEQQIRMTRYAHEEIKKLMGEEQEVDWEPLISVGSPAHEITRLAGEKAADLAIAASHGRSGLKRLLLGSVTERLMRTLPCPLMVVRASERGAASPAGKEITFKRILVGCDFSAHSDLAFQYGLSLAQEFQADLYLAHVIEPPVYQDLTKSRTGVQEEEQQDLGNQLKEKLGNMVPEEARSWCTPITVLLAGQPHEELTKYAVVHDMDLIVLGVRGQNLVETLFVGSTTDRVIRDATRPVLSVLPTVRTK